MRQDVRWFGLMLFVAQIVGLFVVSRSGAT